ncbi:MAG: hypothetical protein M1167_00995 [Chloroflexi bacterium]|nr:hypothetical protein [Chloroflexota bacterium]
MPWVAEANPIPYPDTPSTELPILTVQTPNPSSPIYAGNNLELSFNVTKPQSWDSYYHDMIPTVGKAQIFLYFDGELKHAYPWTQNTVDQYTAVFANLTRQQHTVWIDVYCDVFAGTDGYNASVSQTLTFTIDAQTQTIAFHEDPVVTTRPGTRPTYVPPNPPMPTLNPTATPTATPFPTTGIPEFPATLAITFLLMAALASVALFARKRPLTVIAKS